MTETAPRPVLRFFYQPTVNRVAVDVAKLLYPLALGPDIEVVIAALPEMRTLELLPQV